MGYLHISFFSIRIVLAHVGLLLAFVIGGCATKPQLVGHLLYDTDIITKNLVIPDTKYRAVLLRSEHENLLDVHIEGPRTENTLNSLNLNDFATLMSFTTTQDLPPENPEIFIPILTSSHLALKKATVSISRKTINIELSADRLGVDLLLTGLTVPGGLQGVAYFPSVKLSIPLEGQAFRPEFAWGQLYVKKNILEMPCYGIKNESEYPFYVWDVKTEDGIYHRLNMKIMPFAESWSCLCGDIKVTTPVEVTKSRAKTVPNELLKAYLKRN